MRGLLPYGGALLVCALAGSSGTLPNASVARASQVQELGPANCSLGVPDSKGHQVVVCSSSGDVLLADPTITTTASRDSTGVGVGSVGVAYLIAYGMADDSTGVGVGSDAIELGAAGVALPVVSAKPVRMFGIWKSRSFHKVADRPSVVEYQFAQKSYRVNFAGLGGWAPTRMATAKRSPKHP